MSSRMVQWGGFVAALAITGGAVAQPVGRDVDRGFCRADSNGDSNVSFGEALAHGERMFNWLDRNSDGVITRDESPAWSRHFAEADTNHDNKITRTEHDATLRLRFARLDRNADGFLSRDELMCGPRRGRRCRW